MIGLGGQPLTIYLAMRPVDFRKGHDGLSSLVQQTFGRDPFSGAVFVFRSKRADRIKILVFDRTGLVLAHKRLEGGKFVWPGMRDGVMRCDRRMGDLRLQVAWQIIVLEQMRFLSV